MMRYTYYCLSTHLYNDRRKQMGNFFTSSQIYNDKDLNKQQFIDKFCKSMSDSGYTVCDSDESEMSYILRFAEKSKWVAIASELYGEGGQIAQADAGRIAKMLGTYCMNTEVIDSDCAAMSLYDKDGKSADMLLMGRYDDYFGDDNPKPNEKIWTQFLSDGSTWEQFNEILGGEYVFVEDGLAQLAPVIGMDSGNLLFSAEDDVDDESAVFLDFKKAETKKEKKLTLNTAFKQIFGDGLKVQGFQVVKGRYPYLVRVINDEILHVISIRPRQAEYPEDKAFSILGGIATVYRKSIDLDTDPMENYHWLRNDVASFYLYSIDSEPDRRLVSIMSKFNYFSEVPKSLPCVMEEALEYAKKYMISYMNETNTLEKCIDYFVRTKLISTAPIKSGLNFTSGDFYDDGLIYLKTNYKHHKEKWEEIIERKKDISEEKYNRVKEFYKFFSDDEYIQGLANELERRKQKNLLALENIGIDI